MPNEVLRKPEEKSDDLINEDLPTSGSFDVKKFQQLIALRREKLESIRPFIQLKTYHIINEKIATEEKRLEKVNAGKEQESKRKIQQDSGLLPRAFFELRTMKPKTLRID